MSELPSLAEMRRLFVQRADVRELEASLADTTAMDAKVAESLTPLWSVVRELVEWLVLHEPEGDVSLTATWHDRLVLVDVRDTGADLPKPESVRADAEWAARLLKPPGVEWGAEVDQDGHRLWAALSTSRQRPGTVGL